MELFSSALKIFSNTSLVFRFARFSMKTSSVSNSTMVIILLSPSRLQKLVATPFPAPRKMKERSKGIHIISTAALECSWQNLTIRVEK